MIRFIKIPIVVFNEELDVLDSFQEPLPIEKIPIKRILNTAIVKDAILTEEVISNIVSIKPMYPFTAEKQLKGKEEYKDIRYEDLSVVEYTRVYQVGIVNSNIGNINISPIELINLVNEALIKWQEEDIVETEQHMEETVIFEMEMEKLKKKSKESPPQTPPIIINN